MSIPLGIDLGTTFSAVACIPAPGEPPRVIRNGFGRAVTPSVVCFADGAIRVGDEARELQETGADAAAFFKRAMGDPSFTVELGGRPHTATDLSAHVLAYLRALAADHLGADVRQAVVTVPAYFNNLQRQATIHAGEKAGLEVLSIVNEPTAAARAYGLRPGVGGTVLVYDLGGGTFDVSLVRINEGEMRVVATGGDHNLGGKDWDDRLLAYLADRRRDDTGEELLDDPVDELLVRTEKLKRALSERSAAEVALPGGGRYEVTRARFEELTRDLLDRTRTFCAQVLDDASVRWDEVTGRPSLRLPP